MRLRREFGSVVSVVGLWSAMFAAAIAVVIVRWPIEPYASGLPSGGAIQARVYETETWWLIALLLLTAVIGLVVARARTACALLCGGFALGLAGTGIVAVRRWNTSKGFGSTTAGNLGELRVLAAALALVAGAAAIACLFAALSAHRPVVDAGTTVQVLAALTIVVGVPLAMGWEFHDTRTTQFGAHALMYGIPWAATLVAGAFAPALRRVALATPLLAGALLASGDAMIPGRDVRAGYVVAACIVAVCLVAQSIVDQRHTRLMPATPAS